MGAHSTDNDDYDDRTVSLDALLGPAVEDAGDDLAETGPGHEPSGDCLTADPEGLADGDVLELGGAPSKWAKFRPHWSSVVPATFAAAHVLAPNVLVHASDAGGIELLVLLLGALVLWYGRTAIHIGPMKRLSEPDMRKWAWFDIVATLGWMACVAALGTPSLGRALPVMLAAQLLFCVVTAQLSEIARENANTRRVAGDQLPTGCAWLREQGTLNVPLAQVIDSVPIFKAANRRARRWRFSGLVAWVGVAGVLSMAVIMRDSDVTQGFYGHHKTSSAPVLTTPAPTPTTPHPATARPTPSASLTPSPTTTNYTTPKDAEQYDDVCIGQGQQPGADVQQPTRDLFVDLFLGPGAYIAGCAQPTEGSTAAEGCQWERGVRDGTLQSVAVVNAAHDDVLFLADAAATVLTRLRSGECVSGSRVALAGTGDVQLINGSGGTGVFVRPTEYLNGNARAHVLINPVCTRAWLAVMDQTQGWLWPVVAADGTLELVDQNLVSVPALITVNGPAEATLVQGTTKTVFRGGTDVDLDAVLRWAPPH